METTKFSNHPWANFLKKSLFINIDIKNVFFSIKNIILWMQEYLQFKPPSFIDEKKNQKQEWIYTSDVKSSLWMESLE